MTIRRIVPAVILLAAFSVLPASAAPVATQAAAAATANTAEAPLATQVQYRGRGWGGGGYAYRGGYGGWRGRGAWPWVGLGAGIAAGAIVYDYAYRPRVGYYYDTYDYDGPYYYPRGYSGDARELCARHFKSFEWRTGMYTTYGGERKLCPYLQ